MQDEDSQNMTPLSAREVIERFGGIRPAAKAIGVAFTTVQGWKERDHIPDHRWQELHAAAAEQGIDLGTETADTPAPSKAEPKPAAAEAAEAEAVEAETDSATRELPPTPDGAVAVAPVEPEAATGETGPDPVGDIIVSSAIEKEGAAPEPEAEAAGSNDGADTPAAADSEPAPVQKKSRTGLVLVLIILVAIGAAAGFWPQWRDKVRPLVDQYAPELAAHLYPSTPETAPTPATEPAPAPAPETAEAPAASSDPAPASEPAPESSAPASSAPEASTPPSPAPESSPPASPAPAPVPAASQAPSTGMLAGIDERLAALEGRLDNLPAAPAADPVDLEPLLARLAALEEQAAAPTGADPALLDRLAALEEQVATVSATDSKAVTAIGENLAALASRVETLAAENTQLRQQLADLRAARQAQAAKGSSLALAVNQLAQAVNRRGGYEAALKTVTALAGDDAATATALADLAAFAETGAPDLAALRADFPAVARNVMKAIALAEGDDWLSSALARVKSLVSIRRVGETVAGDAPDALLARAEVALADGDVATAVEHVSALPEPGLEAAAGWLDRARGRLAVTNAIDALQSEAIGALSK